MPKTQTFKDIGSISRMKTAGSTPVEIAMFRVAMRKKDEKLLNMIKCRCTKDFECEICKLKRLQKENDLLQI